MNYAQYVDDLAKRGIIDGHISEMLMAKHREEAADPTKAIADAVKPILEVLWEKRHNGEVGRLMAEIADAIDNAISGSVSPCDGAKEVA